jgi:hypothetical protein
MKSIGPAILLCLLATGCSHHDDATSKAGASAPPPAQAAGPKHDAAPSQEALDLTFAKTLPVADNEHCLVAAASSPSGVPLDAFAYMHDPKAYGATQDPFTHKDMAKAIGPTATKLIATDNPSGTRYISFTAPANTDVLNAYQETWQHYHGFPMATNFTNGISYSENYVSACSLAMTNAADFTIVRVADEAKARAVSQLIDKRTFTLRYLAKVDGWKPTLGSGQVIEVQAELLKVQILDPSGNVVAEDTKTPNSGTP